MYEDRERTIEELEQRLFDERRERDTAQRRSATLFERVEIWRRRAEERAVRIKTLEAERDELRSSSGWRRRTRKALQQSPTAPRPTAVVGPDASEVPAGSPVLPGVRCVTAVASPDLVAATAAFDSVSLDAAVSLMEPDVVIVDAEGFASLPNEAARGLIDWASAAGRPPLVATDNAPFEIAQFAQNAIGADDLSGRFFDPTVWSPATRTAQSPELAGIRSARVDGFGNVVVEPFDPHNSRHLELAAQGTPFAGSDANELTIDAVRRLGVQYRRYAFERRITEMERFCGQLMLNTPTLRPTVAGLLVTNRPREAAQAIERLGTQEVPNFEVVVGCHGFSSAIVADELERLAAGVPVTVLEFGSETSLGECLNRAVSATGADTLAKMDDDDHYGPAYLVDAVHALSYGGAPIVGKGASFTYIESEDRTVIRRPGTEERLSNGSPTGATLVWARAIWEANPFVYRSLGEDLAFVRGARRLGQQVYTNSVYEFVYHRRRSGNTWQAADAVFLEGSAPAWGGEHPTRADVPSLRVR